MIRLQIRSKLDQIGREELSSIAKALELDASIEFLDSNDSVDQIVITFDAETDISTELPKLKKVIKYLPIIKGFLWIQLL